MERPIEGPEPYFARLDSKQAGKWIADISDDLFEELMDKHLPTVKPIYVGKYKMWAWMDVAVLGYLLGAARIQPANKPKKNANTETADGS